MVICEVCKNTMDERAAQTTCGQFVCLDCVHGNSDAELLEKLGFEALTFDMFRDSFERITAQADKDYGGFQGRDLSDPFYWSAATSCLMETMRDGSLFANVGNLQCDGLFDHVATFVYINHYLMEAKATADPASDELHHIARCLMGVYPWPQVSLDEWLHDHHADISRAAYAAASSILERFDQ
jgi:hypothetical protein